MPIYDYRHFPFVNTHDLETLLNEWGKSGWRVLSMGKHGETTGFWVVMECVRESVVL
jgi:hypothetical protein